MQLGSQIQNFQRLPLWAVVPAVLQSARSLAALVREFQKVEDEHMTFPSSDKINGQLKS